MNPNAKEFKFNPGASAWKPTFAPPAPAAEAPAPAPSPAPLPAPSPAPSQKELPPPPPEIESAETGDDDAIDENDPLWIATLKIAGGDRSAAVKMLEDPDALMVYPEIRAIMEGAGGDAVEADDWESSEAAQSVTASQNLEDTCNAGEAQATVEPATKVGGGGPAVGGAAAGLALGDLEEELGALEEEEIIAEGDPREHLNLVFIGHVDAGKSTLSGSILYIMGKVDKRTIEKFEREAKERNRESWFLAFIMDTSEEERAKGKTVEVGRAHFETDINRYTILDAPGHKNYVPNMIAGCCQADVAVLVISARKGEFETGFEKGGQTREHALLAKTLGVQFLVVVVNKMDDPTVEWDRSRFDECVSKLRPYLKGCGFVIKTEVKFIPISGLTGDNILNEVDPAKCPWWREMHTSGANNTSYPTLLSQLDALRIAGRNADANLRIPVLDRYFEKGCVVMGKVEMGTLRKGDEIAIAPTRTRARVESIQVGEHYVASAKPGENVLIKFRLNAEDVQKGYVLSSPIDICPAVTEIRVKLSLVDMLDHRPIFSPGYDAVMHVHTQEIEVTCAELIAVIDNDRTMRRPFARQGQQCIARLVMGITTCMETFKKLPAMGRITLRDEGKTIAIGKIDALLK